jgi:hypothetical protein
MTRRHDAPRAPAASAWPRYSATADDVQYLDPAAITTASSYGAAHRCGLWDPVATGRQ